MWRRLAREGRHVEADEATTFAPAIIGLRAFDEQFAVVLGTP